MRRRIEYLARRAAWRRPPFILMYHRIADIACDPWELAVSPERFAQQIEVVVRTRRPVPFAQLAEGRAPDGAIAITFDDGYIDMLVHAKPVLEKFNCPATVFIPTGLIGQTRDFWWDELTRLVLESPEPPHRLTLAPEGRGAFRWEGGTLGGENRAALHHRLWTWLLPLPDGLRRHCLDELARQIGVSLTGRDSHRAMTAEEVRLLASDLIEIGAHTVTHPALPLLSTEEKRAEIIGSQRACEALLGRPARSFSYPHGMYDQESLDAVREAGFVAACTTEDAPVTGRARRLEMPRIHVKNWDGETFAQRMRRHFIGESRVSAFIASLRGGERAAAQSVQPA